MSAPGRACPSSYSTQPAGLEGPPAITAETIYVVGGLYGNRAALAEIGALVDREEAAGLPTPVLIFNGDFNWFNVTPESFRAVNAAVLEHHALRGNVEAELADPTPGTGCGCAYPDWVEEDVVTRSNRIMEQLREGAAGEPDLVGRLADCPRHCTVRVGPVRVGILHGDPDSLAGWGLAVESMPPPSTLPERIAKWFRAANVHGFACAHTCLPYLQDFEVDGQRRLVINNGAAGMPNFHGDDRGVLTRISTVPAPFEPIYGTRLGGVHWEALGVSCTPAPWVRWFEETWPPGSPAWISYHDRIVEGPSHRVPDAIRLSRGDETEGGHSGASRTQSRP